MKNTRKFQRSKRHLKIARDLEGWQALYAFDAEMQKRGILLGLPYWQVRPPYLSDTCAGIERLSHSSVVILSKG